jgi:hypothetical protein
MGIVTTLPVQSQKGIPDKSWFASTLALDNQFLRNTVDLEIGNKVNLGFVFGDGSLKACFEEWNFIPKGA